MPRNTRSSVRSTSSPMARRELTTSPSGNPRRALSEISNLALASQSLKSEHLSRSAAINLYRPSCQDSDSRSTHEKKLNSCMNFVGPAPLRYAGIQTTRTHSELDPKKMQGRRQSISARIVQNGPHPPIKASKNKQGRVSGKRMREGFENLLEPKAKLLKKSEILGEKINQQQSKGGDIGRRELTNLDLQESPFSSRLSVADHGLVRIPFHPACYTTGFSRHDYEMRKDELEVSGYVTDIYQRLYHAEASSCPRPYMDRQPSLNSKMRGILVDWIVEVHMKFRLVPETLYLSINIMDRYLSIVQVERQKLQLVGVTALLVACKYEEIYPPEVKDCVYITDRAYSRQEVIDMESHIMKILHFRLTVPTAYPFLQRFLNLTKATKSMKMIANYYMERMLQEYCILNFRPSLVAAAAVSLALNNPDVLEHEGIDVDTTPGLYTKYRQEDVLEVANVIACKVGENVTTSSRRQLDSVRRKYQADRLGNASVAFMDPKISHLMPDAQN